MADYPKQVTEIELDLEGIPKDLQSEVKDAVGELIQERVLDYMGEGKSPLNGKSWKKLDKKYSDKEHGGDRTPRLELTGDLKAALGYEKTKNGIVFGVLDESQDGKADGHNNLSGQSQLPQRRFIPDEGERYSSKIMNEVNDIVDQYRSDAQAEIDQLQTESADVTTGSILSNQTIADLLLQRLLRR